MIRQLLNIIIVIALLFTGSCYAQNIWTELPSSGQSPARLSAKAVGQFFSLDEVAMQSQLAPANSATTVRAVPLPLADGTIRNFSIKRNALMPEVLAKKYPDIIAFDGVCVDDPAISVKMELTDDGIHAMISNIKSVTLVDPVKGSAGIYRARNKGDEVRSPEMGMHCGVLQTDRAQHEVTAAKRTQTTANGYQLKTYRLALACDHQYAIAATGRDTPTVAQTLARMVITMNRVNGVYEKEFSVTIAFTDREDTLIFTRADNDPYGANNENSSPLLPLNQKICDSFIGNANYDIGHIFTTGAGGQSSVGCVCDKLYKAQSCTGLAHPLGDGFDIDYVTHEMGHEFGADHSFNNNIDNFCAGQAVQEFAYEPGSGSTIMAYAGICSPDNLVAHSDAYFCAANLLQISTYLNSASANCAVKTNTGNKPVANPLTTASYFIPYKTPFELTVPKAQDSVSSSSITYCWEQHNLGDFGHALSNTYFSGPIFRSYPPDTSTTRIFPRLELVLAGRLTDIGTDNNQGEKAPDVARYLTFKLTTRNLLNGKGCYLFPDDSVHIDAVDTKRGFTVTSQGDKNMLYLGGSLQTVTWDRVGSQDAPISTSEVDIYLSGDGGYTWPWHLGSFPNNGSAAVTLPNPDTTLAKARIKVKGKGNVFFNINGTDFAVINNPDSTGMIKIFPVPAHNTLNILTGNRGLVQAAIYTSAGKRIWEGEVNGLYILSVSAWPRGVYYMRLIDVKNQTTVRKFVLE